jgi:hypothetical protein
MRILKEGDKSQAVCLHCKLLRDITYRYETYLARDQDGKKKSIDNVLQGFCDKCGNLAAIPAQSTPKIRLEVRKNDMHVEARVTPPLEDVLYTVSSKIRIDPQLTLRVLANFFTQEWLHKPISLQDLMSSTLGEMLLQGKSSCRVSSKLDASTMKVLDKVQLQFHVSRTELLKAVLIGAGKDLVTHPNSQKAKRFFKSVTLLGPIEETISSIR